jgi:hypothetical protein
MRLVYRLYVRTIFTNILIVKNNIRNNVRCGALLSTLSVVDMCLFWENRQEVKNREKRRVIGRDIKQLPTCTQQTMTAGIGYEAGPTTMA